MCVISGNDDVLNILDKARAGIMLFLFVSVEWNYGSLTKYSECLYTDVSILPIDKSVNMLYIMTAQYTLKLYKQNWQ